MLLGQILILPFIFIYSPKLLMMGSARDIAVAAITAILGVVFLSFGLQGYFIKPASWPERILLVAGGLAMIVPGWSYDIIGIGSGALPIIWQVGTSRLARARASPVMPKGKR